MCVRSVATSWADGLPCADDGEQVDRVGSESRDVAVRHTPTPGAPGLAELMVCHCLHGLHEFVYQT
jgi:hypothetical protein